MSAITYSVPGMSCSHCEAAVKTELLAVAGVDAVDIELDDKLVHVRGSELDDARLRAAIDDAGYQAV